MGCVLLRSVEAMVCTSFFFGYAGARMAGLHLECALGQRTCLVEYHRIDSGYGIQVVPSL